MAEAVAAGEIRSAFAMTEPAGLSDATNIEARISARTGVINARKW
jgi:alkylation response protein AidB-like acyl-CoA dehydrogenase